MIDLHTHVLPELDDGSESLEESLVMLRMAAAAGTTDVAATPHANDQYAFDPTAIAARLEALQLAAGESPRLHYGCEMRLTLENVERALKAPAAYTIAYRGYLLVELPDAQIPRNTGEILGWLMGAGMRPILAHPERNPLLQTNFHQLEEWVERGCVLQITGQSLVGRFGRRAAASAAELVKRGLAHVVASDAHRAVHRPLTLDEARRHVEDEFGSPVAQRLFLENPECILQGQPILPPAKRAWWRRTLALR